MADYKKYPNTAFVTSPEEKAMIQRVAQQEKRSISNLVRTIVLPEIEKRLKGATS